MPDAGCRMPDAGCRMSDAGERTFCIRVNPCPSVASSPPDSGLRSHGLQRRGEFRTLKKSPVKQGLIGSPLPRDYYDQPVVDVARQLLGRILVRVADDGICAGRIVETEAYLSKCDSASHSFRGPNRKNATMFRGPGLLYVYTIHARCCMNVVTEPEGVASAVLLRAVEPLEGLDAMAKRRGTTKLLDLARGPARLCEALAVHRQFDGWDLTRGDQIWIAACDTAPAPKDIGMSSRIGVTSASDLELRFFLKGNRFVSGPRRLSAG
jgi:DNA-3-methyladenine glycosylase